MILQDLKFSLHKDIIGKSFRYVKDKSMWWESEDYIEEIRLILKKIEEGYPGAKGDLACDILKTDKPDARGTKSAKQLNLMIDGRKRFYDINILYQIASHLDKTVATLLFEIELKIAAKKSSAQ